MSLFGSSIIYLSSVALVVLVWSPVFSGAASCAPIYPECVCKTPDTFNCSTYNTIYKQISSYYLQLQEQGMRDAGDFIGGSFDPPFAISLDRR